MSEDSSPAIQDDMGLPRRLSEMKQEAASRGNGFDTAKIASERDRIALLEDQMQCVLDRLSELEEREHERHG